MEFCPATLHNNEFRLHTERRNVNPTFALSVPVGLLVCKRSIIHFGKKYFPFATLPYDHLLFKKPVKGWVESSRHCAGCCNELVRNIGIDLHRVQWSQFRPTRFSTLRIAYAVAELKISQLPKAVCLVFLKSCLLRSAYKILEF